MKMMEFSGFFMLGNLGVFIMNFFPRIFNYLFEVLFYDLGIGIYCKEPKESVSFVMFDIKTDDW